MDRKGFTLIELLATITILGILSIIAVVSVSTILNNSKNRAYCQIKESIGVATENYMIKNKTIVSEISIQELINTGFLDNPIDPVSKRVCDNTASAKVTVTTGANNNYVYTSDLLCNGKKIEDLCEE